MTKNCCMFCNDILVKLSGESNLLIYERDLLKLVLMIFKKTSLTTNQANLTVPLRTGHSWHYHRILSLFS